MNLIPTRPSNNYTKAPNEILLSDALTPQQKLAWLQLQSLCIGGRPQTFDSIAEVAAELCTPLRTFQRIVKSLEQIGLVERTGRSLSLLMPSDALESVETAEAKKLSDARSAQKAWNEAAPKNYVQLRKPFTEKVVQAIRAHMDHLRVETNVGEFVTAICKGAKADDFWCKANAQPAWIFGQGDPTDKKTGHVTKLYELSTTKKAEDASWDIAKDQDWIDWYTSKDLTFTKVERLSVDSLQEAYQHELDKLDQDEDSDTIFIYGDQEQNVIHWTLKRLAQYNVHYLPTPN